MAATVDLRLWLSTFHNQRNLCHQASILTSVALLVTGFVTFIHQGFSDFGNFDDFGGSRRRTTLAWVAGAMGMMVTALNTFLSTALKQAERHNPLQTDEQMNVRRTKTVVIGCIGLSAVCIGEFILLSAAVTEGFIGIPIAASLAGLTTLITIGYDVAFLVRPGRITLDEAVAVPLTVDEFDP